MLRRRCDDKVQIGIASKTKLSSFLTALLIRAGEEVVSLSGSEKRRQLTLKSETDGYFIVYPESVSYEQAKEKQIELFILDLEEEMSEELLDMLVGQNGIVFCVYQGALDLEKEEELSAKYEAMLDGPLREKSTLLARVVIGLEEREQDFIIHTGEKTCEFGYDRVHRIHMFDVEMIEDLFSDIGLWCERKGQEEKENWVF